MFYLIISTTTNLSRTSWTHLTDGKLREASGKLLKDCFRHPYLDFHSAACSKKKGSLTYATVRKISFNTLQRPKYVVHRHYSCKTFKSNLPFFCPVFSLRTRGCPLEMTRRVDSQGRWDGRLWCQKVLAFASVFVSFHHLCIVLVFKFLSVKVVTCVEGQIYK